MRVGSYLLRWGMHHRLEAKSSRCASEQTRAPTRRSVDLKIHTTCAPSAPPLRRCHPAIGGKRCPGRDATGHQRARPGVQFFPGVRSLAATHLDSKSGFEKLLLDESPDALIATTTDGRVLYWSRGGESIFG